MPLNPNDLPDGNSEYSWGPGMFPPGIANGEGQRRPQDDFGANMVPPRLRDKAGDASDNYARAVADRRTDPTDPDSNRDFDTLGNPDRYGAAPPLVSPDAPTERNVSYRQDPPPKKLVRKW
ncbi:hypothetical protein PBI_ROPE_95 [Mycobacterium phage Rope]|uniref:Uncharacterized protein n=8 Tax=Papyrusvirus TaxID=1982554 RepID=A0A109QIM9_9CAUD|nr:hypothetical protein N842_gp096 [Mycobacterium phage Papyrus]YP_009614320.1 hypothetical protein FDI62_gp95 [Mycobacterium phage Send513]AMB17310.1 hypothetical protein SEA_WEISS13_96 [Mycobacterium phage Weiss13]ARW57183.1 hypothetical protein SEA_ZENON_98 [Mycobacterium phage Zenon]AVO21495.1 hypothetical protein PBI_NILO_99 [Mycobacterium phage Nilo]AYQ98669.1 hypothetical protein SEA_RIPARIAN_98 [Mycobacterium phage Riparian]QCG78199.1 hypothetical protein SEA_CANDLE_92 [Mycobacterium 